MTTPTYHIGDLREFTATFKDKAGTPTDPATAVLHIREPDGVDAMPSVSSPGGTGVRAASWTCAKPGRHRARWVGTGVVTAEPFEFHVLRKETA